MNPSDFVFKKKKKDFIFMRTFTWVENQCSIFCISKTNPIKDGVYSYKKISHIQNINSF